MSDTRIVLVTGTDTGVGKTWVTCALARALVQQGRKVVAIKPVETGTGSEVGTGEDGVLLAAATGQAAPREALHRFTDPLAPALAAERQGRSLDFDSVLADIERHAEEMDVALVESAGGLLAPVAWDWNAADLAESLGARVLVVGADRLGVINHALLTLGAAELAGLLVAGVVLTAPEVADASTGTNAAAIARLSGLDRVLTAPRTRDPAAAASALTPALPWFLDDK